MTARFMMIYNQDRDPLFVDVKSGDAMWILPSFDSLSNLIYITHLTETMQSYYEDIKTGEVTWTLPPISNAAGAAVMFLQQNTRTTIEQRIGSRFSAEASAAQIQSMDNYLAYQDELRANGVSIVDDNNEDDDEIVRDSNFAEEVRPSRAVVMRTVQNIKNMKIKTGYLNKLATQSGRNWKRRFFILTPLNLAYYVSEEPGQKPKGELQILPNSVVTEENEKVDPSKHGFGFKFNNGEESITVAAPTALDRSHWMQSLRQAISTADDILRVSVTVLGDSTVIIQNRGAFSLTAAKAVKKYIVFMDNVISIHPEKNLTTTIEGVLNVNEQTKLKTINEKDRIITLIDSDFKSTTLSIKFDCDPSHDPTHFLLWKRAIEGAMTEDDDGVSQSFSSFNKPNTVITTPKMIMNSNNRPTSANSVSSASTAGSTASTRRPVAAPTTPDNNTNNAKNSNTMSIPANAGVFGLSFDDDDEEEDDDNEEPNSVTKNTNPSTSSSANYITANFITESSSNNPVSENKTSTTVASTTTKLSALNRGARSFLRKRASKTNNNNNSSNNASSPSNTAAAAAAATTTANTSTLAPPPPIAPSAVKDCFQNPLSKAAQVTAGVHNVLTEVPAHLGFLANAEDEDNEDHYRNEGTYPATNQQQNSFFINNAVDEDEDEDDDETAAATTAFLSRTSNTNSNPVNHASSSTINATVTNSTNNMNPLMRQKLLATASSVATGSAPPPPPPPPPSSSSSTSFVTVVSRPSAAHSQSSHTNINNSNHHSRDASLQDLVGVDELKSITQEVLRPPPTNMTALSNAKGNTLSTQTQHLLQLSNNNGNNVQAFLSQTHIILQTCLQRLDAIHQEQTMFLSFNNSDNKFKTDSDEMTQKSETAMLKIRQMLYDSLSSTSSTSSERANSAFQQLATEKTLMLQLLEHIQESEKQAIAEIHRQEAITLARIQEEAQKVTQQLEQAHWELTQVKEAQEKDMEYRLQLLEKAKRFLDEENKRLQSEFRSHMKDIAVIAKDLSGQHMQIQQDRKKMLKSRYQLDLAMQDLFRNNNNNNDNVNNNMNNSKHFYPNEEMKMSQLHKNNINIHVHNSRGSSPSSLVRGRSPTYNNNNNNNAMRGRSMSPANNSVNSNNNNISNNNNPMSNNSHNMNSSSNYRSNNTSRATTPTPMSYPQKPPYPHNNSMNMNNNNNNMMMRRNHNDMNNNFNNDNNVNAMGGKPQQQWIPLRQQQQQQQQLKSNQVPPPYTTSINDLRSYPLPAEAYQPQPPYATPMTTLPGRSYPYPSNNNGMNMNNNSMSSPRSTANAVPPVLTGLNTIMSRLRNQQEQLIPQLSTPNPDQHPLRHHTATGAYQSHANRR